MQDSPESGRWRVTVISLGCEYGVVHPPNVLHCTVQKADMCGLLFERNESEVLVVPPPIAPQNGNLL
jgi:hypothetical protein